MTGCAPPPGEPWSPSSIVTLNVGGATFATTVATLTRVRVLREERRRRGGGASEGTGGRGRRSASLPAPHTAPPTRVG